MKSRSVFSFAILSLLFSVCLASVLQKLDRSAFYAAIKSTKIEDINNELSALTAGKSTENEAFEGALLMRKAGLVPIPAEKLKLFKSGRIKLETVLMKDSTNAEYRFLRLIIQEHAPKIVKYNKQLSNDKLYVIKSYKNLAPVVKQAIVDYSKSSKILRPQDFD